VLILSREKIEGGHFLWKCKKKKFAREFEERFSIRKERETETSVFASIGVRSRPWDGIGNGPEINLLEVAEILLQKLGLLKQEGLRWASGKEISKRDERKVKLALSKKKKCDSNKSFLRE